MIAKKKRGTYQVARYVAKYDRAALRDVIKIIYPAPPIKCIIELVIRLMNSRKYLPRHRNPLVVIDDRKQRLGHRNARDG